MTEKNDSQGKPDKPQSKDHVIVVVNGVETAVNVHGNPSLTQVVTDALAQTNNTGQPVENWELRGPDSAPIADLAIKFKKLGLTEAQNLYLNLRAGIGG